MAVNEALRGIITPMATPLKSPDALDEAGLERLVEHVLAGGVHGLFILGSTGEAPALSYRLRREVIDRACRQVAGRVPLLVGITDTAAAETIEMAAYAHRAGADAVVLTTPYYYSMAQAELLNYLERLVPQLPLPAFLYNLPGLTKVPFQVETVRRAAQIPGIAGLKDSSGDMVYFHELQLALADRPEFSLFIGKEELLAEAVLLGAHGGVCGGANLFPELYVKLYEAAVAGDLARVRTLHGTVMRVSGIVYGVGSHASSYLKGLKCALSVFGICGDTMAQPFRRFHGDEAERIQEGLSRLGLWPAASGHPAHRGNTRRLADSRTHR